MGLFKSILSFVVKRFWPWFKNFVWPLIQKYMVDLLFFILDLFTKRIKDFLFDRTNQRKRDAENRAASAESAANRTSDPKESEKLRAIALVWREVAEQLMRDNEELNAKLEEMKGEVQTAAQSAVEDTRMDVDFSRSTPVLRLGNETHDLPALPE